MNDELDTPRITEGGFAEIDRLLKLSEIAQRTTSDGQLAKFDGFEPLTPNVNFQGFYLWPDITLGTLGGTLDHSWSAPITDGHYPDRLMLRRMRTGKPTRALHLPTVPNAIESSILAFDAKDQTIVSGFAWFRLSNGSVLHPLGPKANRWQPGHDLHQRDLPVVMSMALDRRYRWSVLLGYGDGPRLRFATDPRGAREIFALRDLPDGRARRAALRHWVEGHYRRVRRDEEALAWVRKHLRGAVDFSWRGLRCRIEPGSFDLELDQLLRNERAGAHSAAQARKP